MNPIIFFHTIPLFDFLRTCLLFVLGIYYFVKSISFKQELKTYKRIFYFSIAILTCALGLYATITGIKQNTAKQILVALTEPDLVLSSKQSLNGYITIPWDSILKIEREDYFVWIWWGRRNPTHEQLKIYYRNTDGTLQVASINLHYLDKSDFVFFSQIRKFYTGPILKEFKKGRFQTLTKFTNDKLIWDER